MDPIPSTTQNVNSTTNEIPKNTAKPFQILIIAISIIFLLAAVGTNYYFNILNPIVDVPEEISNQEIATSPIPPAVKPTQNQTDDNFIKLVSTDDRALYYVNIIGANKFQVTDTNSKEYITWYQSEGGKWQGYPYSNSIQIEPIISEPMNYTSWMLMISPEETFTLSIEEPTDNGSGIEITYGVGNYDGAIMKIFLNDLDPEDLKGASIIFSPEGISTLRLANGGYIKPSAIATGKMLEDKLPPEITVSTETMLGSYVEVTITANDPSGITKILYSLDGSNYEEYKSSFEVDTSLVKTIYVFADDKAGNRGALPTREFTISK